MDSLNKPYISVISKPSGNPSFDSSIAWKNSDIGFNWVSTEYPYLHTHEHFELFIVTHGSLKHVLNGKTYVMQKGEACVLRPNDQHMILLNDDKPTMQLSFLFKKSYCKQLFDAVQEGLYDELLTANRPLDFKLSDYDLNQVCTKMRAVQRFIPEIQDENIAKTKICFIGIFNQFVNRWMNFKSSFPPWLESLLGNLNNSDLFLCSSEEIAKQTPYSYSRMTALFKQYVGLPLAKYLNRLKMNRAVTLLINSPSSVLDIALDLGYESLSSFNHSFKATFGVSPTTYRKNNRAK